MRPALFVLAGLLCVGCSGTKAPEIVEGEDEPKDPVVMSGCASVTEALLRIGGEAFDQAVGNAILARFDGKGSAIVGLCAEWAELSDEELGAAVQADLGLNPDNVPALPPKVEAPPPRDPAAEQRAAEAAAAAASGIPIPDPSDPGPAPPDPALSAPIPVDGAPSPLEGGDDQAKAAQAAEAAKTVEVAEAVEAPASGEAQPEAAEPASPE